MSREGRELEIRGTGRTGVTCFRFNDGGDDSDDGDGDDINDNEIYEETLRQRLSIASSGSEMVRRS